MTPFEMSDDGGDAPYEVEFTVTVHVRATDEDAAYKLAEPIARESAAEGAWCNYDECSRLITEEEFSG